MTSSSDSVGDYSRVLCLSFTVVLMGQDMRAIESFIHSGQCWVSSNVTFVKRARIALICRLTTHYVATEQRVLALVLILIQSKARSAGGLCLSTKEAISSSWSSLSGGTSEE